MSTDLDRLLRDTLTGLADEARPADLAGTALHRAGRMRARRRVATGVAAAVAVLAAAGLGSTILSGGTRSAGPVQSIAPRPSVILPASGPIAVQGSLVVLAAKTADGQATWVYDRAHDRYTRLAATSVVPAPAGNRVAIVAPDGNQLTIEDLTSGTTVGVFGAAARWPVAWSPDGRQLAVLALEKQGPQQLIVVDAKTGASRTVATADSFHCGDFCFVTWHPDGEELAVTVVDTGAPRDEGQPEADLGVQLYSVADGHQTRLLPVHGGVRGPHSWSPDQRYVVVDGYEQQGLTRVRRTQVVQVATGAVVGTLPDTDARNVYWAGPDRLAVPRGGAVDLLTFDGKVVGQVPLPPDFAATGTVVLATL